MPLSDPIRKEIARLANANKQDDLVKFIDQQFANKKVAPEDLYEYAKNNKSNVLSPGVINKIGVLVSRLKDRDRSKFAPKFYKLAATRKSHWACGNYARCLLNGLYGVEKAPNLALKYAQRAVELSADSETERHRHTPILFYVLISNKRFIEAIVLLGKFLPILMNLPKKNKDSDWDDLIAKICKNFNKIIDKLISDFEAESSDSFIDEDQRAVLGALAAILKINGSHHDFNLVKQRAYLLKAKLHDERKEDSEAWLAYCGVDDSSHSDFPEAVAGRVSLLKKTIKLRLQSEESSSDSESSSTAENASSSSSALDSAPYREYHDLPGGIPFDVALDGVWNKEAAWFSSVDEVSLEKKYEEKLAQLQKLIDAKKLEIELLEEYIE